ncbi:MAG: hypothetical protein Q9195_000120 [Heterodermia aff. obscurata]
MSSGWIGPGANSSPQNQEQLAMYNSLKAQVDRDQKEKRDVLNAERASLGLPPVKDSVWVKSKEFLKKITKM